MTMHIPSDFIGRGFKTSKDSTTSGNTSDEEIGACGCALTGWPKKVNYHILSTSLLIFFTSRLSKKFATEWHALHTCYVTSLPCKT